MVGEERKVDFDELNARMQVFADEEGEYEIEDFEAEIPKTVEKAVLEPPIYIATQYYKQKGVRRHHYVFRQNGPFNEKQFMEAILKKAKEINQAFKYAIKKVQSDRYECYDLDQDEKVAARFSFKTLSGPNCKWVMVENGSYGYQRLEKLVDSVDSENRRSTKTS